MANINVSAEEQRQLDRTKNSPTGGFSTILNPHAPGQPFSWYNDPRTGREMRLPADAFSQATYMRKGYRLGKLPVGEQPLAPTPSEGFGANPEGNALPANVQEIVNAAVQAALKAVGYTPAEPESPVEPKQLEFQF